MNLANAKPVTTLAVTDLNRSKQFYGKTLGLKELGTVTPSEAFKEAVFQVGNQGVVCLYERPDPSGSSATACSFEVDDVESTVKELSDKNVRFEEYDLPDMGLQTKNGIATMGDVKAAWFKDPDGNILSIGNSLKVLQQKLPGESILR